MAQEPIKLLRRKALKSYLPLGDTSIDNLIESGKLRRIYLGKRAVAFSEQNVVEIQQELFAASEARTATKTA